LKVLDLSNAIAISAESLIQLVFKDAYSILHQVIQDKPCTHSKGRNWSLRSMLNALCVNV
jgi:hypothetical protein